jgi:hypothetical protein
MGFFSRIKDKVTLGSKLDLLPRYEASIMHYVNLVVPDDANHWRATFAKPAGVKLTKECLFNDVLPKKAAAIMLITAGGSRTENFGPANPTAEFAAMLLLTMVAINKVAGEEETL